METEELDPDWTRVYGALANAQRRAILRYLRTTPGPVTVRALARHLVLDSGAELSKARVEALATGLYHIHLPKLLEADLVDWQQDVVDATPLLAQVPLETLYPPAPDTGTDLETDRSAGAT